MKLSALLESLKRGLQAGNHDPIITRTSANAVELIVATIDKSFNKYLIIPRDY